MGPPLPWISLIFSVPVGEGQWAKPGSSTHLGMETHLLRTSHKFLWAVTLTLDQNHLQGWLNPDFSTFLLFPLPGFLIEWVWVLIICIINKVRGLHFENYLIWACRSFKAVMDSWVMVLVLSQSSVCVTVYKCFLMYSSTTFLGDRQGRC